MNKIILLGLGITLLLCLSYTVYAGIGIDPIQVEIQVEQGVETKGICKIFNTGGKPINAAVRLENWLNLGVKPDTWLRVEPISFKIEPGKFSEVEYIVSVPIGSTGELMAMAFFGGIEEGSNVGAEFGIPFYVSVKGTEIVDVEIVELVVDYNVDSGISGFVDIMNKGNVHIRPHSTIHVLDSNGKSAAFFGVPYGLPVHVGKERSFNFSKKDVKLKPGRYKVIAEANYGQVYGNRKKAKREVELVIGEGI